jgi:uncharacterized protein YggE
MKTPTLVTLLSVLFALASASKAMAADEAPARSITTLGNGSVSARPDTAEVRMIVFTKAVLASSALTDNDVMTENLLKRLDDLGIPRKDMQFQRSGVSPQYSEPISGSTRPAVIGYYVTSDVRARVRHLDNLGAILDDLGSHGRDLIQDVRLVVGDRAGLYAKARKQALADARYRAQQYARDAGLELGELLDIREQSPETNSTQYGDSSGADDDVQEFKASVSVSYAVTKRLTAEMEASRQPPPRPRRDD